MSKLAAPDRDPGYVIVRDTFSELLRELGPFSPEERRARVREFVERDRRDAEERARRRIDALWLPDCVTDD